MRLIPPCPPAKKPASGGPDPYGGKRNGFGLTYKVNDTFSVDVRYYDTDTHAFGDNYESRVGLSLKSNF